MVLPLLVIIGWFINKDLTLEFGQYEAFSMFLTIVIMNIAIKDGTSNWIVGISLIAAYVVISIGFWAHKDQNLNE
jgi:Ca2+:H+ antiporter